MPIKRYIYLLPLSLLAAVLILFVSRKPLYNWDMIAYIAVVEEYSDHDLTHVHKATYAAVKEQVPPSVFSGLTANIEDRRKCLLNAKAFGEELSFFRTKPLYTSLIISKLNLKQPSDSLLEARYLNLKSMSEASVATELQLDKSAV